jgi:hypothetical protein
LFFKHVGKLDSYALAKLVTEKGKEVEIGIPKELHSAFDLLAKLQEQVQIPAKNRQYVFGSRNPNKLHQFEHFYEKAVKDIRAASRSSPTLPEIAQEEQIIVCPVNKVSRPRKCV